MSEDKLDSDAFLQGAFVVACVLGMIFIGPLVGLGWMLWKHPRFIKEIGEMEIILTGGAMLLAGSIVWYLWLDPYPFYQLHWMQETAFFKVSWKTVFQLMVIFWWCGSGIVLMISPLGPLFKKPSEILRTIDFKNPVKNFKPILTVFENPLLAPIGIDIQSGKVVTLEQDRRASHVIVLGATGSGKTTLMVDLILHAIRHGQPLVVIDPKGDNSTLETVTQLGNGLSPDFNENFRLFTIAQPEKSAFYNPLKHGNALQLKDRIMEALSWSEQYYESMAGDFLTLLTSCTEYLKIPLTLDFVSRSLRMKEERERLLTQLEKLAVKGDRKADVLFEKLALQFKKVKADDLAGLDAQLSIINNPTIGHLLSFSEAENEIDLREVLKNNQIAYFQLDTLGNSDTARRLGRMVVEDLKGLSSYVYKSGNSNIKFFPVFIDEFGSFATKEFIEFLKQVRGAKFSVHLFCQGLEDLDVVSKEFRRQASSNPMTKIALRLDDPETVEGVCSMAGTIDALEQSYQIEGNFSPSKTGRGNMRETKQMRIEHDVLKNLGVGQAVLIEKSPTKISAVQIWNTGTLEPFRHYGFRNISDRKVTLPVRLHKFEL